MQLVKWITTGILILPLAEIVAFVVVASQIGFAKALVLLVLISFFGVLVLRHAGAGQMTRLRTAAGGDFRTIALGGGRAGTALGGILLVIPGFVTGRAGLPDDRAGNAGLAVPDGAASPPRPAAPAAARHHRSRTRGVAIPAGPEAPRRRRVKRD